MSGNADVNNMHAFSYARVRLHRVHKGPQVRDVLSMARIAPGVRWRFYRSKIIGQDKCFTISRSQASKLYNVEDFCRHMPVAQCQSRQY